MLRGARRRAHGRGAVRLFLRLCRRPRRDDRAGLAGAPDDDRGAAPVTRWSRRCTRASRLEGPRLVERWLDRLDASGRYALLKLVTGGLRVGVSARLAKQALADFGGKDVTEIEEIWHGLTPPYVDLFAWLEGTGRAAGQRGAGAVPPGDAGAGARRGGLREARPGRLRRRMEMGRHPRPGGAARAACGGSIRAPATTSPAPSPTSSTRSISRARSTASCWSAREADGAIAVAPFADLQQRLNRKTVSPKLMREPSRPSSAPTTSCRTARTICAPLPFAERRKRLEAFVATLALAAHRPVAARRLRRLGASWRGCAPTRRPTGASTRSPKG